MATAADTAAPNLTDARVRLDGEQWSRELLDRLRAGGFGAEAWRRFLADAFERARDTRARRPLLVLQSRRWGAVGAVASAPLGARAVVRWTVVWAMLDWHLGMVDGEAGPQAPDRERRLGAADALSLARLWAAPLVRRHPHPLLVAAGIASDVADGALARRAGPTRLGRDLDSAADTLFLSAALSGCTEQHGLSERLLTLERARLVATTALTLASYFARSEPAPSQPRRAAPAALTAAGAVLAAAGRTRVAEPLLAAGIAGRLLLRVRAR